MCHTLAETQCVLWKRVQLRGKLVGLTGSRISLSTLLAIGSLYARSSKMRERKIVQPAPFSFHSQDPHATCIYFSWHARQTRGLEIRRLFELSSPSCLSQYETGSERDPAQHTLVTWSKRQKEYRLWLPQELNGLKELRRRIHRQNVQQSFAPIISKPMQPSLENPWQFSVKLLTGSALVFPTNPNSFGDRQ